MSFLDIVDEEDVNLFTQTSSASQCQKVFQAYSKQLDKVKKLGQKLADSRALHANIKGQSVITQIRMEARKQKKVKGISPDTEIGQVYEASTMASEAKKMKSLASVRDKLSRAEKKCVELSVSVCCYEFLFYSTLTVVSILECLHRREGCSHCSVCPSLVSWHT